MVYECREEGVGEGVGSEGENAKFFVYTKTLKGLLLSLHVTGPIKRTGLSVTSSGLQKEGRTLATPLLRLIRVRSQDPT